MRFLSAWMDGFRGCLARWTRLRLPTRAVGGQRRRAERVRLGVSARLKLHGAAPVWCVVEDASDQGVRLTVSRPLPPGSFADLDFGHGPGRLRAGLRVMWAQAHGGSWTLGARLLAAEAALRAFRAFLEGPADQAA